mmetsp:Transcript_22576/g.51034  ORF Transcript_22576/g.51034 Transcript_22576/m.51034 type:complete len:133 (-) Transcript_22576:264-662(-)
MGILISKKVPKPQDVYNAVKSSNVSEVTKLLSAGGSPEKYEDPFTADVCLHVAANKGHVQIVSLLLDHKADVNRQNKLGSTALHCAAGYGLVEVVQRLLEAGAVKTVRDLEGKTPCDLAKAYGKTEVVRLLE